MLTTAAGAGTAGTFYVTVSWVSALGQEGSPSGVTALATADGTELVVEAVNPPAAATGFNVYIGTSADTLALQTPAPVAVGQNFTLSGPPIAGRAPGNGQAADVYVIGGSMLRRG